MYGFGVNCGVDRLAAEKPDFLTGLPHPIISGAIAGDSRMKRIDISTKTYPNTFALVDDKDYEELNKHKWCPREDKRKDEDKHNFYAIRALYPTKTKRVELRMHRVILNAPKGTQVDHIDGNGLNNQRHNMRLCTNQQNNYNRLCGGGTSKFKGVSWQASSCKWLAFIKHNQKSCYLGGFLTEKGAAKVYDQKAREIFGEFACVNFPKAGERSALAGVRNG